MTENELSINRCTEIRYTFSFFAWKCKWISSTHLCNLIFNQKESEENDNIHAALLTIHNPFPTKFHDNHDILRCVQHIQCKAYLNFSHCFRMRHRDVLCMLIYVVICLMNLRYAHHLHDFLISYENFILLQLNLKLSFVLFWSPWCILVWRSDNDVFNMFRCDD